MKKPEFLKTLSDVEIAEGQNVKLRVKVKGHPQPRISWFKDGNFMKSTRNCRLGTYTRFQFFASFCFSLSIS